VVKYKISNHICSGHYACIVVCVQCLLIKYLFPQCICYTVPMHCKHIAQTKSLSSSTSLSLYTCAMNYSPKFVCGKRSVCLPEKNSLTHLLKDGPKLKVANALSMNLVSMESTTFLKSTRRMRLSIFFLLTKASCSTG
jgi:hypothetical protein